jgi:hypothetical protein
MEVPMSTANSRLVGNLFQAAQNEGVLSAASMQALNVVDIGAQIQAALGAPVDQVTASEVVLLTIMPDDSGSIRSAGNVDAVRDGHNMVLDALAASKQKDSVLAHCRYLNGQVLYPYCAMEHAARMDPHNYNPNQGTPLFDQTVVLLGTVLAKAQEFQDNGVPVRTVTLIITDGGDCHSQRATAASVRAVVTDMLKTEQHIIAGMGISDGSTDFRKVFASMGLRPEWILTPKSGAGEVRKAFQVFSQSALRASQGGQHFSKTALGGFFTN